MGMGRAMFDDITPPNEEPTDERSKSTEHSIRKIAPLATQERETRRARRAERRMLPGADIAAGRNRGGGKSKSKLGKYGMWGAAILVLVVALSAIGFVFIGKTTITVVPQQEVLNLTPNIVHTAYREAEEGELAYTLVTHSIEASESIPATGREVVEEKASGKIMVYNNHSEAPQRLIKNTRFESPNGEIYRVRNSFVVPGKNSNGTPGTIEVTVFADKAGEEQNVTALGTRFTIPGLKGDPRYDTFHAELTTPITGGFVGERAIVDESTLAATKTKLQSQLREKVVAELATHVPENMQVFEGGIFTTFESLPVTYTEDEAAAVREVARITAVAFNKNDLARMLAATTLANPEDGDILIDTPGDLTMVVVNKEGVDIVNDSLIQFTLEGRSMLTWQIDTEALKQDLVGKHSGALNTVMSGYPGIKSAQATIRPFWKSEFPTETGGISVEIVPEETK